MRPALLTRIVAGGALLVGACACRATEPDPRTGTFLATTFTIAPAGQGPINVLAEGGALGINIANNFVTAGTLILPPNVTGGATLPVSLAGTADTTATTVRFITFTNTFVRSLTFTLVNNTLQALNQTVADTTYTLVLTRQ